MPWLLWFIVFGIIGTNYYNIPVISKGLICSVGMLFFMLVRFDWANNTHRSARVQVVLVVSTAVMKWQMNKSFGVVMILAYIAFCVIASLLELEVFRCPFASDSCAYYI